MTNIKGRYFISYRRLEHRVNEAVLVRDAMRIRGLQIWRDLDNLQSAPTETQLVDVINSDDTAGAILLVCKEVSGSSMIRNVEARNIFKRHSNDPSFFVLPVLIGLEYDQANACLNNPAGLQNLTDWNLYKVEGENFFSDEANSIANLVLEERIKRISEKSPDEAIEVVVGSKNPLAFQTNHLTHDFTHLFENRFATERSYQLIKEALLDTKNCIFKYYKTPDIHLSGKTNLPIGVLYGALFSEISGVKLSWFETTDIEKQKPFSLQAVSEDFACEINTTRGNTDSNDVIVSLSINADNSQTVGQYLSSQGLNPRGSIHITPSGGPINGSTHLTEGQCLKIVEKSIKALRDFSDELGLSNVNLHLFLACPLGLSILLGQKLNTFSQCTLYEYDPNLEYCYYRAITFSPSM